MLLEEPDGRRPIMRDGRPPGTDAILSLAKVGGARAIDVYHRHQELRPTAYVEAVIEAIFFATCGRRRGKSPNRDGLKRPNRCEPPAIGRAAAAAPGPQSRGDILVAVLAHLGPEKVQCDPEAPSPDATVSRMSTE